MSRTPRERAPRHSHKCSSCGRVWSHKDHPLIAMDPHSHTCSGCGEEQWDKYDPKAAPAVEAPTP